MGYEFWYQKYVDVSLIGLWLHEVNRVWRSTEAGRMKQSSISEAIILIV